MRLRTWTTMLVIVVAAAAVVAGAVPPLTVDLASAWFSEQPCDFLTGGGWILPPAGNSNGAKANFAIGGGCKHGSTPGPPPIPYWGHLNYLDHGTSINPVTAPTPFHVHWSRSEERRAGNDIRCD